MAESRNPAGLILAGGRGSRMGGDTPKPLIDLAGRPLISHVIDSVSAKVEPLILAAPLGKGYERFGLALAPDRRPGLLGPLAGIEAGLWTLAEMGQGQSAEEGPQQLLVAPGDTPFLPHDLVPALQSAAGDRPVIARFAGRPQPAASLWPLAVLADLGRWLDDGRPLAIRAFLGAIGHREAVIEPVPDAPDGDPFFNVNTPADLARAEAFLAGEADD
ncbi:molybdenum cofactor guanylyltransferase [Jiella avicenniae]|uniref:Molybdenum cofactor guanylyltransferase n=1 Tax=Jiella avicenniae TaxID=2907202 RepID=A0A9X1TC97_9HYPH|nr:molybdenum cofactor guanylyltransferase [Jiella avicenniae]